MPAQKRVLLACLTALFCSSLLPAAHATTKVSKYAYLSSNGQIAAYTVNPDGGVRSIQALADAQSGSPVVSPDNKFVYTLSGVNGSPSIAGYKIGTNGTLTQLAGSPFASTGAIWLAFTPNSKFAYGVDYTGSDNVEEFSVNTSTGALTSIGTIYTGADACDIEVNSKGTFAYVSNCGGSTISVFKINTTSGALTAVAGSPFECPGSCVPVNVLLSPNGKYLFSVNFASGNNAGSILVFSVNAKTGALAVVSNDSFPSEWGFNGGGASLDPSGQFLYVASNSLCCAPPGTATGVEAFSVDETNGAVAPIGIYAAGSSPFNVNVDSSTGFLYVANGGGATATEPPTFVFSITPGTGALTEVGTYGVDGQSGSDVAFATGTARAVYTPTFAYATNPGTNSITEISIAGGGLTQLTGSPLTDPNGPRASTANGEFFYTGNGNGSISEYTIGKTGALKKIKGSPITGLSNPTALVARPYYDWLYVTDPVADVVDVYNYNPTTGVLSLNCSCTTDGAAPLATAVDPLGQFTLVVNSGSNDVYIGIPYVGFVNSVGTGNDPVAITLDPSSQYVYVTNSGDGTVSAYNLTLASPYLTQIGSAIPAGTSPSAVIAEPYGRYLYVANSGSNTISAYSINALTGALTPISGTFPTVTGPSALAVSNDANYLYVTGPSAGELQQFTINSDGTLTNAGGGFTGATSITTIGTYK